MLLGIALGFCFIPLEAGDFSVHHKCGFCNQHLEPLRGSNIHSYFFIAWVVESIPKGEGCRLRGDSHRQARALEMRYLNGMASRRLRRLLLCGALGCLWTRPLAADTGETIQFVESYRGTHPNEFNDLLRQVKSIVPVALVYITGQWGLPNQLHSPMIVMVTEVPPNLPAGVAAAYVRSVMSGGLLRQVLIVDMTHYLQFPAEDLDHLLYHEMAHAVLQDAVTSPAAVGIPQWFNEGLAQSVTSEGHDRTAEDFKRYGHSDARAVICDLNGHVDTFYNGEYNFGCYTYFYLAVQRLIARGGKDTLVKVITGLHDGTPLPLLVGQVTSLDWPAFQRDVEQYTRDVFAGQVPIP